MAHETAVHRADGQLTVGIRPVIDPVIAADGIDEWLGFLAEPDNGEGRASLAGLQGKMLHVHVTDPGVAGGEWMIRPTAGGATVEAGHGKGDVAVRGPASDLLLVLMRRLPPGDPAVEVLGDAAVLDELLAATPF
jgi:ubiquinone biosynthesis protein UbiJ